MPTNSSNQSEDRVHARAAGLVYVSDVEPGIRRVPKGTGFSYQLPSGNVLSKASELARIRALAVPPAWVEVWICLTASGHIQATGRDDQGRKQYRYHNAWRELRDENKYDRILDFARLLPRIRRQVERDMSARGAPTKAKVLATVVSLLDKTLIRIGNREYARQNDSYGLTTLRNRHLAVKGSELRFHFKGKSGKVWRLNVRDRRIARVVRGIQELPGQHLFQYVDEDGASRAVTSGDVNGYLREISGEEVSAKDFRTWAGTVLAVLALAAAGPFETQTQSKMNVRRAIEAVATKLGNTVAVCRKCYVHPEVIDCYLEGALPVVQANGNARPLRGLPPEEKAVLTLLEKRLRPKRRRSRARRPSTNGAALRKAA